MYAIDHMGHGRSALTPKEKGFIGDYNILVDDFVSLAVHARSQHSVSTGEEPLPLFVLAHSMGTLVALCALRQIPDVTAVILSGCAINAGPDGASPFGVECLYPVFQGQFGVRVASVMATLAPRAPVAPIKASVGNSVCYTIA